MGYISVGADPANFTTSAALKLASEGPPIVGKEIDFLIGRLRDISKHAQSSWQGYMDQKFNTSAVIPRDLVSRWPVSVSATIVMNKVPPSQRPAIYQRALAVSTGKPFLGWVMAKWPSPKTGPTQIDSNDPQYQGDPLARQKAYESGTVKNVVRGGVVIAKDGKVTEEGAAYIQQQQAAKEAAAGLLSRIPGGIFTVLGVAGVGAFLFLRKRGG